MGIRCRGSDEKEKLRRCEDHLVAKHHRVVKQVAFVELRMHELHQMVLPFVAHWMAEGAMREAADQAVGIFLGMLRDRDERVGSPGVFVALADDRRLFSRPAMATATERG